MSRVLSISFKLWLVMFIGVTLCILSSCKKPDYEKVFNNPALYSNTVYELNSVVMGNNFTPVVASRSYAYATIAGYEVVAAGNPKKFQSLAGQLNDLQALPKPFNKNEINYPYAALLAFCKVGEAVTFPAGSLKYYTLSKTWSAELSGWYNTGGTYGQFVSIPTGMLNVAFQKKVLNSKGSIKLNVQDALRTFSPSGKITNIVGATATYHNFVDTQVATLAFTYSFGKLTNVVAKRETGGAENEKGRAH